VAPTGGFDAISLVDKAGNYFGGNREAGNKNREFYRRRSGREIERHAPVDRLRRIMQLGFAMFNKRLNPASASSCNLTETAHYRYYLARVDLHSTIADRAARKSMGRDLCGAESRKIHRGVAPNFFTGQLRIQRSSTRAFKQKPIQQHSLSGGARRKNLPSPARIRPVGAIPLDQIKPHPRNNRTHSEKQIR
jgi:hypothetical protein